MSPCSCRTCQYVEWKEKMVMEFKEKYPTREMTPEYEQYYKNIMKRKLKKND